MKATVKYRSGRERTMSAVHAKILVKLGRAQYLTRDMVAAPVAEPAPAQVEPVVAPVLTEEVDANGAAWDETVHASSRLKNADGTWRKRPGAKAAA